MCLKKKQSLLSLWLPVAPRDTLIGLKRLWFGHNSEHETWQDGSSDPADCQGDLPRTSSTNMHVQFTIEV